MDEITEALIKFRNERDWEQFHNPKDLALAINVEAGELLELFLWKNAMDANPEKVKEELADVFAFAFLGSLSDPLISRLSRHPPLLPPQLRYIGYQCSLCG